MNSCLLLAISDFTQPFIVECDAYGNGIGVILIQNKHPITLKSRKLDKIERAFGIYNKKILVIMHILSKLK